MHIHIAHLIWIMPLSSLLGICFAACCMNDTQLAAEEEAYRNGVKDGMREYNGGKSNSLPHTFGEWFEKVCNSDLNKFKELTGGFVYGTEMSGQLFMVYIDNFDEVCNYSNKTILATSIEGNIERPILRMLMV